MPESIALAQLTGLLEDGAQLVYVLPPDGALRRARPGDRLGVARSDPDRRSIDRGRCADGRDVGATPPPPRLRLGHATRVATAIGTCDLPSPDAIARTSSARHHQPSRDVPSEKHLSRAD